MSKSASILDAKLSYLYSRIGANTIKLGLETTRALMQASEKLAQVHKDERSCSWSNSFVEFVSIISFYACLRLLLGQTPRNMFDI